MNELIPIAEGLAPIAAGVGLIALFGRDPKADQHDLSDYHEPAEVGGCETVPGPPTQAVGLTTHYLRPVTAFESMILALERANPGPADDILPPAPPGTNAGDSPIYASLVAERVLDEQLQKWGATTTERADRILRELGDKAQMEATR